MLQVLEAPLLLVQGDLITAKVRAFNSIGWGEYSPANTQGQAVEALPAIPTFAPIMISQSETAITVELPEIYGANSGGSEILTYNLHYNMGGISTNYISIVGEAPENLLRTITKGGLQTNVVFKFKYRVKSKYGWSKDFSPVLEARTATLPAAVTALSFSIVDLLNVRVGWSQPYNGGSPIMSYTILFQHRDGVSFSTLDTYCDGGYSTILLQRFCDIPFTVLRQEPLQLQFDDLIVVKVYATNVIGSGPASLINTEGVKIQTEPLNPLKAPKVLSYSEYSASLSLDALTNQ